MKVILLGDTHLGATKSSDIFHDYFEKFYDFMFEYIDAHDIGVLIQVGDLYDYRKEIHFNTIHKSNTYFIGKLRNNHNIKTIAICGNHDSLFKNTNRINSVDLMVGDFAMVVDMTPQTMTIGGRTFDFFPWINSENLHESMQYAKESTSDYAIGHFEFSNFPMHQGIVAESGMSHKEFSNYTKVISGHYHTFSQKDNVMYTGTPYELTWVDCNDPKGFWVLDTDTDEIEFVQNPYTLFEKISYVEGMEYIFSRVTGKYVKIIVVDKKSQKLFDSFVAKVNDNSPIDVKIVESSVAPGVIDAVELSTLASTMTMMVEVIDTMDADNIDKAKLKYQVVELYNEAMSINNAV